MAAYANAIAEARRALFNTSAMLDVKLSPPVSSFTRASKNGVLALPLAACGVAQQSPAYTPPVAVSTPHPMALDLLPRLQVQRPLQTATAMLAFALLACPLAAQATPQLQCSFDVNSETHQKTFGVVTDPYTTEAVAIGNRFRFKAIVLAAEPGAGGASTLESINLYVYYNTRRQPMIMQHTRFLQPVAQTTPKPDALTGRVSLYSPLLGKELQYQCALAEVAP